MSLKIKRYIIREVALNTLGVLAVLWAFLFCQEIVVSFSRASRGDLAFSFLAPLLLLHLPHQLNMILPLATILGVVFALGRLYADGEMTACFIAGLQIPDLYRLLFPWVAGLTLTALVLNLWILPPLAHQHDLLLDQAQSKDSVEMIQPGRFYVRHGIVFYIEKHLREKNALGEIFIAKGSPDEPHFSVLRAEKGALESDRGEDYLVVEHGTQHQGLVGELNYEITSFGKAALKLDEPAPAMLTHTHGKSNQELLASGTQDDWAELLMRLSAAVMLFQLAFLGIAVSPIPPRGSRMKPLLIALALFMLYNQGLLIIRAATETGKISLGFFGFWHLLFFSLFYGLRRKT